MASFRDFQQRHLSARILRQEIRRAAFAAQDVDLDRMIRRIEQRQRKADLVAVAGALHRIKLVHLFGFHSVDRTHRVRQEGSSCRGATRLNNDADTDASQELQNGKSRKPLPHCTRAECFYQHIGTNQITLARVPSRRAPPRSLSAHDLKSLERWLGAVCTGIQSQRDHGRCRDVRAGYFPMRPVAFGRGVRSPSRPAGRSAGAARSNRCRCARSIRPAERPQPWPEISHFGTEFFRILRESGSRLYSLSKVLVFRPKLLAMQRPAP